MIVPISTRKGTSVDTLERLIQIISPGSQENPWPEKTVQIRNQLFITILVVFGVRLKELLDLRIEDIQGSKILIAWSGGRKQPIPLHQHFANLIRDYIKNTRSKIKGAESHQFLFVSTRDGRPMPLSTARHIFETLQKQPDIPKSLSARLLRNNWKMRILRQPYRWSCPIGWIGGDTTKIRGDLAP